MENIPVSFECEGKNYRGTLATVHGAGAIVYHLMIEKRYNGRLRLTERYGWVFETTPKTESLKELTDFFFGCCYCLVSIAKALNKMQLMLYSVARLYSSSPDSS